MGNWGGAWEMTLPVDSILRLLYDINAKRNAQLFGQSIRVVSTEEIFPTHALNLPDKS